MFCGRSFEVITFLSSAIRPFVLITLIVTPVFFPVFGCHSAVLIIVHSDWSLYYLSIFVLYFW